MFLILNLNSIDDRDPNWNRMAFGHLKTDSEKSRVGKAVLVRLAETAECLKRDDYDGALEKIGNVRKWLNNRRLPHRSAASKFYLGISVWGSFGLGTIISTQS